MRSPVAAAAFDGWFTTTTVSMRHFMVASGWAVAAALFGFFGTRGAENVQPGHHHVDALGIVLVLAASLLIAVVWTWPRPVFVVTTALVCVYLVRYYPGGPIYLVVVAMAAVLGWREPLERSHLWAVLAGIALAVAGAFHAGHGFPLAPVLNVIAWLLVAVVPWGVTALIRMKRTSTREAEAAQHQRQVDSERIRIAREVHDGLGHSLAVISMQAGVALHVAERRPEQAQVALEAIARASRDALGELRSTLALFRGEDAPRTPDPGLADVPALVADVSATGHPVRLAVHQPPGALPAAHDLAVYRIVQESLTNAARHAAHARTEVVIDGSTDRLVVEVRNDATSAPPVDHMTHEGSGLAGMRERCTAIGGSLQAGPQPAGGWAVHAELPLEQR